MGSFRTRGNRHRNPYHKSVTIALRIFLMWTAACPEITNRGGPHDQLASDRPVVVAINPRL